MEGQPPPLDRRIGRWRNTLFWVCPRCETEREDELDAAGNVSHVTYRRTAEYEAALKAFRNRGLSRSDLRLDYMKSLNSPVAKAFAKKRRNGSRS